MVDDDDDDDEQEGGFAMLGLEGVRRVWCAWKEKDWQSGGFMIDTFLY